MSTFTTSIKNRGHVTAGKWHQTKGSVREAWGKVTGNQRTRIAGKQEYMLGVLQEKYGQGRQDAQQALADLTTTIDQKKEEMKDVMQTAKAWIDQKRGITPKRSRIGRLAGLAAATTVTAALAYYLGWVRPAQLESGS